MKTRAGIGPYATAAARMPSLQTGRVADPQVQKALEAIREWLEVRLGARGDRNERAATVRDLQQELKPLRDLLDGLEGFDGRISSLRADVVEALPKEIRPGSFQVVGDALYVCTATRWQQVQLAPV